MGNGPRHYCRIPAKAGIQRPTRVPLDPGFRRDDELGGRPLPQRSIAAAARAFRNALPIFDRPIVCLLLAPATSSCCRVSTNQALACSVRSRAACFKSLIPGRYYREVPVPGRTAHATPDPRHLRVCHPSVRARAGRPAGAGLGQPDFHDAAGAGAAADGHPHGVLGLPGVRRVRGRHPQLHSREPDSRGIGARHHGVHAAVRRERRQAHHGGSRHPRRGGRDDDAHHRPHLQHGLAGTEAPAAGEPRCSSTGGRSPSGRC